MSSDRKAQQELEQKILDTCTAGIVLWFVYTNPSFFNPWSLKIWEWLLAAVLIRMAIVFYDHLVIFMVDSVFKNALLPTRTTGKPVRYVELDTKSYIYLGINALHEWVFVQRLCHFIWFASEVPLDPSEISFANTVGALSVIFIVMDVIYAPCHHILHMPRLYPLIHKHHHRQHFPTRGYLDAGNEHPLEQVVGLSSVWVGLLAAVYGPTGAHGVALFIFFNIHAALAMLNHSPYDVEFYLVPGLVKYSVANHEMHHRKFTVNYAQYCMWYDHLVQTFAPYEGPKKMT